jgi:hypothetical protein
MEIFCADIVNFAVDPAFATAAAKLAIGKGIEDILAIYLASQGAFQEKVSEAGTDDEPAAAAVTAGTTGTTEEHARPSAASPSAPESMPASTEASVSPPSAAAVVG